MKYYTYVHYTADTKEIFYVGKGTRDRYRQLCNRNRWWHNKVNKHGGFDAKIMSHWETESEALDHEKFLIDCLEDLDKKLVNICKARGKEANGRKLSPEACLKHGEASRKKWAALDEETKKLWSFAISKANKGRKKSEEHKRSLSLARTGTKNPLVWKPVKCLTTNTLYPSLTEAAKATGCDPSHVAKCCKGKLKKTNNMEFAYG